HRRGQTRPGAAPRSARLGPPIHDQDNDMSDRLPSTSDAEAKPRRRPRRSAEQNRAEILRAATAEFATHGYAGGRITRIVKKAGTNPRIIYEQFGSKSELYVATLENRSE